VEEAGYVQGAGFEGMSGRWMHLCVVVGTERVWGTEYVCLSLTFLSLLSSIDCGIHTNAVDRYMQGFKCKVTGASPSAAPLAAGQIPTYCADDASKCVKGAKQMLAWHQRTGNNIETADGTTPNYNSKCGWTEGAQTDIFDSVAAPSPTPTADSVAVPSSSPTASANATIGSLIPVSESAAQISTLLPQPIFSSAAVAANDISSTSTAMAAQTTATTATGAPVQTMVGRSWRPNRHYAKLRPQPSAEGGAA